jgi:hypothetical protein
VPTFITIGYGDEAGYERTPQAVRDAAHRNDEALQKAGAVMGTVGAPVQVRNTEGVETRTTDGAYMSSRLPVAGFAIIEADNLDDAIAKIAQSPCAVAHGVIEVWPLETAAA